VRMEGWRQRRPGSNGKTPDKKKKNQLDTNRPSHGRTWPIYDAKRRLEIYLPNGRRLVRNEDSSVATTGIGQVLRNALARK
jgi:hypothetical protein